jgi:hypothetical protein
MNRWRGKLPWIGVSLGLALTGCITHDQPLAAPGVAQSPSNGLTNEQVHWYLQEGSRELRSCWVESPNAGPKTAVLDISVSKQGTVATADLVATTLDNLDARPCLERHIRRIRFPPREAPTTATIKLVFKSRDPDPADTR